MKKTLAAIALIAASHSVASAAVMNWNGLGADTNWMTPANWVGGSAPVGGETLTFNSAAQASNNNNFPAGTNFAGITVGSSSPSATLSGNSINLSGDLVQGRGTTFVMNMPFVLQNSVNMSVPGAGATLTLGGAVSGGFGVTKTGPGLVVLNVAATYTGGTIVSGGTMRTGVAGNTNANFGPGAITLQNGSFLDLRATAASTFNSDLVLSSGGGTVAFRGNATFSPTSVTASSTDTLGLAGDVTGIVITPTDFRNFAGLIQTNSSATTALTIRLATAYSAGSAINAALDLQTGTTFLKQSATNGTTTIDIGRLSGALGSSLGGASSAGSGTYIYSIGNRGESSIFNGNIVSDANMKTGVKKVGIGSLTLTGAANSFSGASSVTGGILYIDGAQTAAAMVMTVASTGTLGGTGSIAGSVIENGILAPGHAGVGTISIVNSLAFSGTSALNMELNGTDTTIGGAANDLVNSVTNLTTGGVINIAESVAGSFANAAPGTWRLINYTGTLTDTGFTLGTTPAIPAFMALSLSTATPGQVNLSLAYVPEPSQMALAALAAPALLTRRRRA